MEWLVAAEELQAVARAHSSGRGSAGRVRSSRKCPPDLSGTEGAAAARWPPGHGDCCSRGMEVNGSLLLSGDLSICRVFSARALDS